MPAQKYIAIRFNDHNLINILISDFNISFFETTKINDNRVTLLKERQW